MAKDNLMNLKTFDELTGLPINRTSKEIVDLAVDKSDWEVIYYNILYDYCVSEFKYEGLEPYINTGVNSRKIEHRLFMGGSLAMFVDHTIEGDPLLFLPYRNTGRYGFYGDPITIYVDVRYDNQEWVKTLYWDECVILHNNAYSKNMSMHYLCMTYAQELADIRETMAVNRNATRTPLMVSTSEEEYLSVANKLDRIMNGASVVVQKSYNQSIQDGINALSTGAPYMVDKLTLHLHDVFNEICTHLGVQTVNTDKKERLVEREADANDEQSNRSRDSRYQCRVDAMKELEQRTGIKIKVVKSQDVLDRDELINKVVQARLTEGGDNSGNVYNDD